MFLPSPAVRSSPGGGERALRVAIVGATAVGAALAATAPTGRPGVDLVWRAALGATVAAAGFRAGPVARIGPALVAATIFGLTGSWVGAAIATAVLLLTVFVPPGPWSPIATGALVGAAVQLLFRLPYVSPDGASAVLAIGACVPVVVSAWRALGARGRRIGRRCVLAGTAVVALAAIPFLVAGALAWRDIGEGSGEANAWRVATGRGDTDAAAAHLAAASGAFEQAADRLGGWWTEPARMVPYLSQHVEAADVGVRSGQRLVGSAQAILEVADPKDLKLVDGALDLDLVAQVREPLGEGRSVLAAVDEELAAVDARWLLPFVQEDVRVVRRQVEDARADADLAARVLDVVPDLLGGSGPRRYFVIFSSPAETRELGGFLGNWGILAADDGRLELEETGRAGDLNDEAARRGVTLTDPESYPDRYVRAEPARYWQNVTSSPDLPTVTRAVADLYEQTADERIDGVLVVDPLALAALLELTGPVDVEGLDEPLTTDNAAEFLLRDQYIRFPEHGNRVDFLADAADATFARLTSGVQPGPSRIADVLGPVVRGRHLLFWSLDEAAHPLLTELGLDGALPPIEGGDVLAVARANMLPNKLDAYITEDLAYDVDVDPSTGAVTAVLTATYTNAAPEGLPPYVSSNNDGLPDGTSRILVSVWTPLLASGATLDAARLPLEAQVELGRNRYLAALTLARGQTVTLVLHLDGTLAGAARRLTVVRQPLSVPSSLAVTVRDGADEDDRNSSRVTVIGG